tara:strand:+ start:787 stop:1272 length:486 start_codon:yes stop_codon:yes gene_type:complete
MNLEQRKRPLRAWRLGWACVVTTTLSACLYCASEGRRLEVFWIEDIAPEAFRENYPAPLISLPLVDPNRLTKFEAIDWDDDDIMYVEVDKLLELIESKSRSYDEETWVAYRKGRLVVWGTPGERDRVAELLWILRSEQEVTFARRGQIVAPTAPRLRSARR